MKVFLTTALMAMLAVGSAGCAGPEYEENGKIEWKYRGAAPRTTVLEPPPQTQPTPPPPPAPQPTSIVVTQQVVTSAAPPQVTTEQIGPVKVVRQPCCPPTTPHVTVQQHVTITVPSPPPLPQSPPPPQVSYQVQPQSQPQQMYMEVPVYGHTLPIQTQWVPVQSHYSRTLYWPQVPTYDVYPVIPGHSGHYHRSYGRSHRVVTQPLQSYGHTRPIQ